jgi:hypothetical protein
MMTCSILFAQQYPVSEVTASESLKSDHLPVFLHLLDHIRTRNFLYPVDNFTFWEQFQSLVSELISPTAPINSEEEAYKATRDFTVSIASAYRISTSKIKL